MPLRTVSATRYVTPLREGGSLPAIIEADDCGVYVLKFRGAGQGPKALIAELIAGELGRALGLAVPELVLVELDAALGRNEPDYEIRALLKASAGLNLALDYLPGAIAFDPALYTPAPDEAAAIVWFDALTTNVDRTARNTNLLLWHRRLQLIDHGAALYFHHDFASALDKAGDRFTRVRDHVLLPFAGELRAADERLATLVTEERVRAILAQVPDAWIAEAELGPPDEVRATYAEYFRRRLAAPRQFLEEAENARAQLV